MKKLVLTTLLCSLSMTVSAFEFDNFKFKGCFPDEKQQIFETVEKTPSAVANLIVEIENYEIANLQTLTKKDKKQLDKAKSKLECTIKKVRKINKYTCIRTSLVYGQVHSYSFLGVDIDVKGVSIGSPFFYNSPLKKIETIMHEASHKCGSKDGDTYFVEEEKSPGRTLRRKDKWSKLAPIYDYWLVNGVCIPSVDC